MAGSRVCARTHLRACAAIDAAICAFICLHVHAHSALSLSLSLHINTHTLTHSLSCAHAHTPGAATTLERTRF
jgi:hypothetical protein